MSHTTTSEVVRRTQTIFPLGSTAVTANVLLGLGLALIVLAAFGAMANAQQCAYSWLFSFLFFFTLAAGSLFWSVVHHAVHAAWTTLFRRLWENVAVLFRELAFFFFPILCFGPTIYRWMQPDVIANDRELHEHGSFLGIWLSPAGFDIRAVLFFTIFISIAYYYRRLSVAQDRDGSPVHSAILQERSYVLLALYGLAVTFAAFDWIMSLDPHWASTMFGVTIFAGASTASVALIIIVTLALQKSGYLEMVNEEHYHLLGKLLFSFVTFWAWVSFGQYLFIWYANIPEETIFFIDRSKGSWAGVAHAMILFKFLIPFLVLLLQATKRSPFWLLVTSLSVLLGHAIELYWLVMPTIHPQGLALHWLDFVTFFGMALILSSFFLRHLASEPIYPIKDPRLQEAEETFN